MPGKTGRNNLWCLREKQFKKICTKAWNWRELRASNGQWELAWVAQPRWGGQRGLERQCWSQEATPQSLGRTEPLNVSQEKSISAFLPASFLVYFFPPFLASFLPALFLHSFLSLLFQFLSHQPVFFPSIFHSPFSVPPPCVLWKWIHCLLKDAFSINGTEAW